MSKAAIAKRNRERGKEHEKALAKRLGGQRLGIFGEEDVAVGIFSIEAKSRKRFAGTAFMDQAIRNCPKGQTPLVIVHVLNQRRSNDLVMVRMSDFEDLYGDLKEGKDEEQKN